MFANELYPPDSADALRHAWHLTCHGEPRRSLAEGARLLGQAAGRDAATMATASLQVAWSCFQLGQLEVGLMAAAAAQNRFRQRADPVGEASATAVHAWLLSDAGMSEEAIDEAMLALSQAEATGHPRAVTLAAGVAGVVFWYARQLDIALELCGRAVALARQDTLPVVTGWWLINQAGILACRAEHEGNVQLGSVQPGGVQLGARRDDMLAALAVNDEAVGLAEAEGDVWGLHLGLCNAAEYLALIDGEAARALIERCESLPDTLGQRSAAHLFYTKARLLMGVGQVADAISLCQAALEQAGGNNETEAYAHGYLADAHERRGAYREALAHHRLFHARHATMAAETTQRRARLAEIRYQTAKLRDAAEVAEARASALLHAASVDPLTGLANRRGLEAHLERLEAETRPYGVAMLDIDHFKAINDRFSHAVGDAVLTEIGRLLAQACGSSRLAVRMGGEEFAILLEDVPEDGRAALEACEAVRRRVRAHDWSRLGSGLRVTLSIGAAGRHEGPDPAAVFALADARLYQAKAAGRDRVVIGDGPDVAPPWPFASVA